MRDLTVGNKFVYGQLRGFQYGDTAYRFYEQVLRDTAIQGKTYGIIFRSFNRSLSIERTDDSTVYLFRNGQEIPTFRQNIKEGDSIIINNIWGVGCDTCKYKVTEVLPITNGFGLTIKVPYFSSSYTVFLTHFKRSGISQFQLSSNESSVRSNIENVIIRGAFISGVLYGDTTTYTRVVSVDQPPLQTAAAFSSKAPNPFSESINLDFSLDAPSDVALQIISNAGEVLATLPQGALASGKHSFRWNGKGSNGAETAQGTYFVRLLVNGKMLDTAKVVKIK
jgi:hypothetical protein